jgi:hypothetical protein
MEFKEFSNNLRAHFTSISKDAKRLYVVDLDKDAIWDLYLASFPAGTNEMFRKRSEHDCSCCRSFIRHFGNVVVINPDYSISTIWDLQNAGPIYQPVVNALSAFVKKHAITDYYYSPETKYGVISNHEQDKETGRVITWNHFQVDMPAKFVFRTPRVAGMAMNTEMSQARDTRNVFKRSLTEISPDALQTVRDLIAQNSIYRGEEWTPALAEFARRQLEYKAIVAKNPAAAENYCWVVADIVGGSVGKLLNHSMGTLLSDIAEGYDLDEAIKSYEKKVAPENYKRPKAVFTQKMLDDAQAAVTSMGYLESLPRRFATLDDITVNNILFANRDASKRMAPASVFDDLSKSASSQKVMDQKALDRLEEVPIGKFVTDILPTVTKIEALVESRLASNLVSLVAPVHKDSPTMFKWGNGFSWAYNGNVTDSMKERVKAAGGKVDGALRFSIQWNDNGDSNDDLDAHCTLPNGDQIFFGRSVDTRTLGNLDVDIQTPFSDHRAVDGVAVENITWPSKDKLVEGTYTFFVNNYRNRGAKSGFSAEIEFGGEVYQFSYPNALRSKQNVEVAKVVYTRKGGFELKPALPCGTLSRNVWGIDTNQYHPVTVCMYSPNYWDAQDGIGNRHYFFMIKDCANDATPNGFFNEYLKEDLMRHKRVFEALGSRMQVAPALDQLSGLGFSSTVRNSVVLRVEGSFTRTIRVVF